VVVVVCGHIISVCRQSFSNVGGLICGRLLCGGGGGSLPWPVLVFHCHVAVSNMAPGFPVSKVSGGRGVFTHLLVVVVASDMGAHHMLLARGWCWALITVGAVHGWCVVMAVLLSCRMVSSCRCCGMVVICCGHGCGESSLLSVMAADMVFLHCSDGVLACPGGCQWWAVVWQRWVGIMGGHCGWWWWWLRKEVVVC